MIRRSYPEYRTCISQNKIHDALVPSTLWKTFMQQGKVDVGEIFYATKTIESAMQIVWSFSQTKVYPKC